MKDILTMTLDRGLIVKINGQPMQLNIDLAIDISSDFLEIGHDILDMPEKLDDRKDEPPCPILPT